MSSYVNVVAYINGLRFSPQSVSFTSSRNSFYRFNVSLPAVREWTLLPKRSHCAVFFVDLVTGGWRLLCEGEYVGFDRSKSGEGTRSRTLHFEGLHACWTSARYLNAAGLATKAPGEGGQTKGFLDAYANGQKVTWDKGQGEKELEAINTLIDRTSVASTRVSAALPRVMESIIQQTPVEAFYGPARKWPRKFFALPDNEIGKIIDVARFRYMLKDQFGNLGLPLNTSLSDVFRAYLAAAAYEFNPVPSPSYSEPDQYIFELLMTPRLNHVVPPACNLIFKDQIATQQQSVNFRNVPTRVLLQLENPDVASEIAPYYLANGDINVNLLERQRQQQDSPGRSVTHGLLSREELDMGVIMHSEVVSSDRVAIPLGQNKGIDVEDFSSYLDKLARIEYEERRGQSLVQSLHCHFLPYLVPGFPTVVEDENGPFYGIIESVQHQLTSEGMSATMVTISHVRDLYQTDSNRTPYYPLHLNASYLPKDIDKTYQRLFGQNLRKHAAMLPKDEILKATEQREDQGSFTRVNLDALAAKAVAVPTYDVRSGVFLSVSEDTVADRLRGAGVMAHHAMLEYQFRTGTSLYDFVRFHGLWPAHNTPQIDEGTSDPPPDLAPWRAGERGARLFGAPYGMTLGDNRTTDRDETYGAYDLVEGPSGTISDERQVLTRLIQAAINEGISRG